MNLFTLTTINRGRRPLLHAGQIVNWGSITKLTAYTDRAQAEKDLAIMNEIHPKLFSWIMQVSIPDEIVDGVAP